ncbi:MAG: hypothetical protein LQ346_003488 [Caloplaca aetnensis]|nr:MAG: hypothetical protein LQ346_003488 [Caloplaca aetnensis]
MRPAGQSEPAGKEANRHRDRNDAASSESTTRWQYIDFPAELEDDDNARIRRDSTHRNVQFCRDARGSADPAGTRGFMSQWGKKSKAIGDWTRLAKYAYITENKRYEPFEELDHLISRVWQIGTGNVQVGFRDSVYARIKDRNAGQGVEIPQHLKDLEALNDPTVIQELYVSIEMADQKVRLERMGRLLAEWAPARMASRLKRPFVQ